MFLLAPNRLYSCIPIQWAPGPQSPCVQCHRLSFCLNLWKNALYRILRSLWTIIPVLMLFLQGFVNTSLAFIDLLITDKLKSAHFSYIWSKNGAFCCSIHCCVIFLYAASATAWWKSNPKVSWQFLSNWLESWRQLSVIYIFLFILT